MRNWILAGVMMFFCGAAAASDTHVNVDCDVHSDYRFSLTPRSVILTRDSGTPKIVLMRQGRLFIDDKWVSVDGADRDRLIAYEREARATMPLASQIGHDAADIAFTALGEVAKGFSKDPAATDTKLKQARIALDRDLASSISASHFDSETLGKGIGNAVGDVMPMLIGDIVGGALRAAFRGDEKRLESMNNLDTRIDAIVEPRVKALARNAQALCRNMRTLDGLDNALDYRHDGKPLDLLRVQTREHGKDD